MVLILQLHFYTVGGSKKSFFLDISAKESAGKTQRFYIVDNYMYVSNNTEGRYCSVATATIVIRMRHNVTLHYIAYLVPINLCVLP